MLHKHDHLGLGHDEEENSDLHNHEESEEHREDVEDVPSESDSVNIDNIEIKAQSDEGGFMAIAADPDAAQAWFSYATF